MSEHKTVETVETVKNELLQTIKYLVVKSRDNKLSGVESMQFTQASLNASNTLISMELNCKEKDK